MTLFRLFICTSIAFFSGCGGLPVVKFGAVHGTDVIPTTQIHYRLGARFGYQLNFPRDLGVIKIREELFLPGPSRWVIDLSSDKTLTRHDVIQQSRDGSMRIRECELADYGAGGWFRSSYKLSPGDPRGAYKIRLWLNGRPPKEFNFRVE
jgi:hypothetical protein